MNGPDPAALDATLPLLAQAVGPGVTTTVFGLEVAVPLWQVILVMAALGGLLHYLVRTVVRRWAQGTERGLDDIVVSVLDSFLPIWTLLAIVYTATKGLAQEMALPDNRLEDGILALVQITYLVTLFWSLGHLLFRSLAYWAKKNEDFAPIHPPVRFVLKALIILVGAVTVLAYLEVDITALAATLGVGGIAVALALRDTLENFFAGLHLMADRPIQEKDTVLIHETGDRGTVLKIGWRSTRILTIDNNILVLPNVKLASGVVTNLSALDARSTVRLQVGVSYDSDPVRVRRILEEVGKSCEKEVPGMDGDSELVVLFHPGFGPSSLDFTVRFLVAGLPNLLPAQSEMRQRIFRRFREEGIEIPYPITTVEHRPAPSKGAKGDPGGRPPTGPGGTPASA